MFKSKTNSVGFRPSSSLPISPYFIFALVGLTAVMMGVAIGQGQWTIGLGALLIPVILLYHGPGRLSSVRPTHTV